MGNMAVSHHFEWTTHLTLKPFVGWLCRGMVVQGTIYTSYVAHLPHNCTHIMAYKHNGTMAIDTAQQIIHHALAFLVHIRRWFIKHQQLWVANHSPWRCPPESFPMVRDDKGTSPNISITSTVLVRSAAVKR